MRLNGVERRFLELIVARTAPEAMGMLIPAFSARPLSMLRFLGAELNRDRLLSKKERLQALFLVAWQFLRAGRTPI